jgi:phosphonate transport system substrate-binding protein
VSRFPLLPGRNWRGQRRGISLQSGNIDALKGFMSRFFMKSWAGLLALLLGLFFSSGSGWAAQPIRIALTPTFLDERPGLLAEWQAYLEAKLGQSVRFLLRDSYQETMELLYQGEIDAAWLCDCPHVTGNREFRLLATPLFRGQPYYNAYLVVPAADLSTRGILDLRDKVFAYTDPYSNAGHLSPRYEIRKSGADPEHFFRRSFFAHSQHNAIEAVAAGLADGAMVNSYVWETISRYDPALTGRTRVASRSQDYGFPPFVVYHALPEQTFTALQRALMDMHADPRGHALLEKMNLDGFGPPQPEIYRTVQEMMNYMHKRRH